MKEFVNKGRFEFVHGGYSLHDEATAHYEDIITNMKVGHDFLLSEFDVTPSIAWQIDQFGHTAANAALLKRMGYDYLVFARAPCKLKKTLRDSNNLEFKWKISDYPKDEMKVHLMYDMYWSPQGFEFDDYFNDE